MDIWRISAFADLSGRGGLLAPGRWHRQGLPVIYCADHPSTAMLEILVHMDFEDVPSHYQLLKITCPDGAPIHRVETADFTNPAATQSEGSRLLEDAKTLLIDVPSAVMPAARNILINPQHPLAGEIAIAATYQYPFDQRLKR